MKKMIVLVLLLCLFSGLSTLSWASNSTDTTFWVNNATPYSYYAVPERAKTDTSPVYVYVIELANNGTLWVQGQRKTPGGSWIGNNVESNFADMYRGGHYSLHTLIYENGGRVARLLLYSTKSGYIEGKWSPDSVGSYTDKW